MAEDPTLYLARRSRELEADLKKYKALYEETVDYQLFLARLKIQDLEEQRDRQSDIILELRIELSKLTGLKKRTWTLGQLDGLCPDCTKHVYEDILKKPIGT